MQIMIILKQQQRHLSIVSVCRRGGGEGFTLGRQAWIIVVVVISLYVVYHYYATVCVSSKFCVIESLMLLHVGSGSPAHIDKRGDFDHTTIFFWKSEYHPQISLSYLLGDNLLEHFLKRFGRYLCRVKWWSNNFFRGQKFKAGERGCFCATDKTPCCYSDCQSRVDLVEFFHESF